MANQNDLDNALIKAVQNWDMAAVRKAVEDGADAACVTPAEIPPEVETDTTLEIMRFLFSVGTDVNYRTFEEGILWTFSAYRRQLKTLQLYLDAGGDVNLAQEGNEVTGLHVAVSANFPDVVQFFLDAGAHVNQACHDDAPTSDPGHVYGETALHFAAARADQEIIEMLLAAGADKSARSSKGQTPLDYAQQNDRSEDIFQLLR
jgi:hypothetical protein